MRRIRGWWTSQNRTTRQILLVLILVTLVSSVAGVVLSDGDFGGLLLNFGTEMGGAVVTFVLITQIVGGTEERERLKHDLIMRMGSQANDTAVSAANELRARGWLREGSLKGAHLVGASLQGVDLNEANLQEANLCLANLQEAAFLDANLQGAYLGWADLRRTGLWDANLEGADLEGANLQEAELLRTNLQGAKLLRANLQGTDLSETRFSEDTVLPDDTKWTRETDMLRFVDPDHPRFWRPEPNSVLWYPAEEAQHGDE